MAERDIRLDSVKGLLILLVVLGHIIGNCGLGVINDRIWHFIYIFHMPLFILVSGYFTSRKSDQKAFWGKSVKIILPLIVFQILSILLLFVFFHHKLSISFLLTPYWTLWYLLSLVFWRVIIQFSPKSLVDKPYLYLMCSLVIAALCGLMPYGRILSIQRTLSFCPFFLLGYYMRQGIIKTQMWPNYISIVLCVLFAILIFGDFIPISFDKTKVLLRGADQYTVVDIPLKVLYLAASFLLSLSVFYIIPKSNMLSHFGSKSLFYYLYHGLVIRFILQPLVQYYQLPQSAPFMLVYLLIVILIIYILEQFRPFRWLTNPLPSKTET
ncbi:MAG: acyltransferase family protein [Bacteroidales bacterium]|nr:acyltransferase family protein [Bacteroidales bacterium]